MVHPNEFRNQAECLFWCLREPDILQLFYPLIHACDLACQVIHRNARRSSNRGKQHTVKPVCNDQSGRSELYQLVYKRALTFCKVDAPV